MNYDEAGHKMKMYKWQKAKSNDSKILIPFFQKDGKCAVKSIKEYLDNNYNVKDAQS